MKYKEMWQSSKVLQIVSEEMDWKVTGYIAGNLLKHKEVSTFEELKQNPFSCYQKLIKKYDDELINNLIYSVININEDAEGAVNKNALKVTKVTIPTPRLPSTSLGTRKPSRKELLCQKNSQQSMSVPNVIPNFLSGLGDARSADLGERWSSKH